MIEQETRRLVAAGGEPARPVAPGGRRGRAAPRVDVGRGGARRGARGARRQARASSRSSIDRELPLVRADSAQLERAFVNVLENARRHSGGHPVSVRARAVRTHAGEQRPRDRAHRRSRPRHSAAAAGARVRAVLPRRHGAAGGHRGSGLGLAIARGFVQANGGKLYVESLPGQGATFVFELPLDPVVAQRGRAGAGGCRGAHARRAGGLTRCDGPTRPGERDGG